MRPDKPINPNKKDLDERRKLGFGGMRRWKKGERPDFDEFRDIKHLVRCAVCGYPARDGQPIYACTKCGVCQACGGLNTPGQLHAGCVLCGNGLAVVQNADNLESVSSLAVVQPAPSDHSEGQAAVELPAADHPAQSGIHITNQNE